MSSACPLCESATTRPALAANAWAVAFLDAFPVSPGHALIVSRRHVSNLFDLEADELQAVRQRGVPPGSIPSRRCATTRRLRRVHALPADLGCGHARRGLESEQPGFGDARWVQGAWSLTAQQAADPTFAFR